MCNIVSQIQGIPRRSQEHSWRGKDADKSEVETSKVVIRASLFHLLFRMPSLPKVLISFWGKTQPKGELFWN